MKERRATGSGLLQKGLQQVVVVLVVVVVERTGCGCFVGEEVFVIC